jgi:phage regulator Rha-like protein
MKGLINIEPPLTICPALSKALRPTFPGIFYPVPANLEKIRKVVPNIQKYSTMILRSQSATSKKGRGGRRYPPYAFTEQGIAMLSSVLNSDRAIKVNIAIMRGFVEMRQLLSSYEEFSEKLAELEEKYAQHDEKIRKIFEAIYQLMNPENKETKTIGFKTDE